MAGIYVHIPFCARRCIYCDFFSTTRPERADAYIDALLGECRARLPEMRGEAVRTLYFGGGTPSLLAVGQWERLLEGLRREVDFASLAEVTVEVNPDDITLEYVEALVALGVNRVSMGVQSFCDSELRLMRRRHDARRAVDAVGAIRRAGIRNVSIDLIYGIPGQTMETWSHSLSTALRLGVEHISAYCLGYEPGTALTRMRDDGMLAELPEPTQIAMYYTLIDRLQEAGYEHYEISNFALPGRQSRHNSAYWDGTPYLGLGASAHSFDGHCRSWNPADLDRYIAGVTANGRCNNVERMTDTERYDEYVMIHLRTSRGVDSAQVERLFGEPARAHLLREAVPHLDAGRLRRDGDVLRLTREGLVMCDAVVRDLMGD